MKIRSLLYLGITFLLIGFLSCEKEEGENESNISSYNSSESHKAGQDCMKCHISGGSGEGWFKVAGTVYDTIGNVYPNATIRLYTGSNGTGTLKATVEVDRNGNFYTTENIDFGTGLYTLVEGNVTTKYMNMLVTSGRCNSCHGVTTNRIWVY